MLALAAIGCVSTGRYEDLEHRYDSVRLELGRTRGENQSLRHQAIDREATLWGARAKLRQEQTLRANAEAKRLAIAADNEQLFAELQRLSDDHDQLQQVRDRLKDSLAVLAARKSEAERRAAELRAVVDRWQSLIDAGSLSVTINDGRMVLTLPSDVLFDSGSAKLNADGKNV
ncbi:MAG TPA: hypothetical protein VHM19_09470, partial [Polyangiales bacterium]|nr:hypothetical protein [Polyangiales bacterium]